MRITDLQHIRGRYSHRPRRRFTTLVALALTLTSLTACQLTDSTPDESGKPVLSSVSAEEAKAIKIDDSYPGYVSPLPTKSGPLHLDITCDMDAPSALVKHDTQDDIVWARKITPRISGVCTDETMTPKAQQITSSSPQPVVMQLSARILTTPPSFSSAPTRRAMTGFRTTRGRGTSPSQTSAPMSSSSRPRPERLFAPKRSRG